MEIQEHLIYVLGDHEIKDLHLQTRIKNIKFLLNLNCFTCLGCLKTELFVDRPNGSILDFALVLIWREELTPFYNVPSCLNFVQHMIKSMLTH